MRIGLISDTHGNLPRQVLSLFEGCDMIIHAGDIGKPLIIDELELVAPVRAVLGNNDWSSEFPDLDYSWRGQLDGLSVYLTHTPQDAMRYLQGCTGSGTDVGRGVRVGDGAPSLPQICIHGHTHVPRYELVNGVRLINPGAVSRPRGGSKKSVAIMEIEGAAIVGVSFIDSDQWLSASAYF